MTQEQFVEEPILRERDPLMGVPMYWNPQAPGANGPVQRLFQILTWKRPYDSATEEIFARYFIDVLEGISVDKFRNRHLSIPYADGSPCKVMYSCHIDTCHHDEGYQRLAIKKDKDDFTYVQVRSKEEGNCLGADDGTGVWLMLEMIAARRPGYYLFHRGEERGCVGSRWLKDNHADLLRNFDAAIAFDRKDFDNIITHQSGERCCSEAFALAIGKQLVGYKPDPTGAVTDTKQYTALIPECTNLSVGYQGQHGPLEKQYLGFASQLRTALLAFDPSLLPIERDPKKTEYRYGNGGGYGRSTTVYSGDATTNRNHFAHKAWGNSVEYPDAVWCRSISEARNLRRSDALWIDGIGYVSRDGVIGKEHLAKSAKPCCWTHKCTNEPLSGSWYCAACEAEMAEARDRLRNRRANSDGPDDSKPLVVVRKPDDADTDTGPDGDRQNEMTEEEMIAEDETKTLLELVEDYPEDITRILDKHCIRIEDVLSEVYGLNNYMNYTVRKLYPK